MSSATILPTVIPTVNLSNSNPYTSPFVYNSSASNVSNSYNVSFSGINTIPANNVSANNVMANNVSANNVPANNGIDNITVAVSGQGVLSFLSNNNVNLTKLPPASQIPTSDSVMLNFNGQNNNIGSLEIMITGTNVNPAKNITLTNMPELEFVYDPTMGEYTTVQTLETSETVPYSSYSINDGFETITKTYYMLVKVSFSGVTNLHPLPKIGNTWINLNAKINVESFVLTSTTPIVSSSFFLPTTGTTTTSESNVTHVLNGTVLCPLIGIKKI